jgi:peptidoglycan hydrolase-like protein with peptidoglycan-binding domain
VRQLYSQRADLYRKKLSGAALEEAGLSAALLKKLQKRLVDLKFLSGTPDGMFGADTRAAIKNYQASIGHPQDNFLSAQERTTLLDTTTVASASTAAPQQPAVSPWEATSPPAGVLQPSIQDPQNADKPQQPGPNVADRTLAQTDQPNAPDAPSPSAQADATGAPVDAGSGFQEQYFIAGALLAVAILGFAAIPVFMILRRPKKRTTGFDDVVGIDPSVGVSMKEDPLRIIPYTQTDTPLVVDLRLKKASKSWSRRRTRSLLAAGHLTSSGLLPAGEDRERE